MAPAGITALLFFFGPLLVHAGFSDFVHFENDLGGLVKPKPPIEAAREGRFIRFDSKDSEIELELGVSVPFIKIPTFLGSESGNSITINIAGLLVGTTILLTSFLLVPLFAPSNPHGHGFARSDAADKTGAWSLLSEADQVLRNYNVNIRECSEKFVCEMTHSVSNSAGDLLVDSAIRMNPVKGALEWTNMAEAVSSGRKGECSNSYPSCFFELSHLPRFLSYLS